MRKILVLVVLILSFSLCALAIDAPKLEVFGGYSYMRADIDQSSTGIPSQNTNGWDTEVTVPFWKYLGVTADIGGQYKSASGTVSGVSGSVSLHEYNFLFGPSVAFRNPSKITPFAHALFGVSHLTGSANVTGAGSGSASYNSFGMAIGGGVDFKVFHMFSIRPAQVDWLRTSHSPGGGSYTQNNFRYAAGIVFTF